MDKNSQVAGKLAMKLNFNAMRVVEIEDMTGEPITDVIGKYSMRTIMLLVQKGLGVGMKEADAVVNEYLETGEMHELYLEVLEALQRKGFLPRTLNFNEIRKNMTAKLSETTGG